MTKEDGITITDTTTPFGPTGQVVYERTYSRVKPNGDREVWPETVHRVCTGNLGLVYGPPSTWTEEVWHEYDRLTKYMLAFAILPAGRHLWASGVKGRQYLFNCHVAGWGKELSKHFEFTALRLFEGGGVGANYSSRFLAPYGAPRRQLQVHIVCDPEHADYEEMLAEGLLSTEYDSDWAGSRDVEDTREGWAAEQVDLIDTYMTDAHVQHEKRVYDVSRVRKKGSRLKSSGGTASGPGPFARMMLTVADVMNGAAYNAFPQRWIVGMVPESTAKLDLNWGQVMAVPEGGEVGTFSPPVTHLTPMQAMEIDHATAEAVVAGGNRRSARMAILHWQDPFIFEFLACKADKSKHWTTNISVEIDQEFLDALAADPSGTEDDPQYGPHEHATAVHEAVVKGMLTNGEPGYWNSALSNEGEPNEVIATNPCGEIALEEWENCNLGHVNMDAFAPIKKGGPTDILGLIEAHRLVTRFLIRATYGDVNDDGQAEKLARNRRIGVGHLGVQGWIVKRGIRYSQSHKDKVIRRDLRALYRTVREAARDYAFELRIPEPVKVTTVAPTGSIAKLPGVPEGIHPVLFRFYLQGVRFNKNDPAQLGQVEEARAQGMNVEVCQYDASGSTLFVQYPTKHKLVAEVEALGYNASIVETADEISMADMLGVQEMYQTEYADNAVSFTVNVPAEAHQQKAMTADPMGLLPMLPPTEARVELVMATLAAALPKLKGTTVMLDGSRPQSPYTKITQADYELAAYVMVGDGLDESCATGACPVR